LTYLLADVDRLMRICSSIPYNSPIRANASAATGRGHMDIVELAPHVRPAATNTLHAKTLPRTRPDKTL
jgi:hypothetical protein